MSKKILVVVDMQNDFITGALGTPEAQAIVPLVVDRIKSHVGPIYATIDTHDDNYLDTQEGRYLPIEHCIQWSMGWAFENSVFNALENSPRYYIVEKETFGSRKLAKEISKLCKKGYADIEIVGVCTDICVLSNAVLLKAFCPEASIVVDSSCCAGTTPEMHQKALDVMRNCQIGVR